MSPTKGKANRAPAPKSTLASQYRAIGPAAIVAALLFTPRKAKPSLGKTA